MPERPTGTVTFLFSDIEGSTRLLQQLRGRYDEVLSTHARLLRSAIEKFDGHEIDTQGGARDSRFRPIVLATT
jgi:class 3 adenylate cyclase